jgi:hypothetical protein
VIADTALRVTVDTLARSGPIIVRTRFGRAVSDFAFTVLPPDTMALIRSVRDVPDDEGGFVTVEWLASDLDVPSPGILGYYVLRAADANSWERLVTLHATNLPSYRAVVPTRADSTARGIPYETFRVDAFTSDTAVTFPSAPAIGYSVDNLAPPPPSDVVVHYDLDDVDLTWPASPAADLLAYEVFRGNTPGFALDDAHGIAVVHEPHHRDRPGFGAHYYRIVTIDVHGNRAASAEIAVGAPPLPDRLGFARVGPNPASDQLALVLALPVAGAVQLEVIDLAGRRVLEQRPVFADPGIQRLTWTAIGRLSPGIYFLRMQQAQTSVVRRFVVSR